jgi:hypothetical protein
MGRRVSNGVVGGPGSIASGIGAIVASGTLGNTLTTASLNQNIIIDPNGSGTTQFVGNAEIRTAGSLRLYNTANTGYLAINYLAAAAAGTRTLTFPDSNGTAGYVLQTDGSGTLSWAAQTTAGVSVVDNTTDSATVYPLLTTLTTDAFATQARRSSTKLTYTASSGTLFATIGNFPTMTGSTSASGQLTINGTNNATKNATASILMPDAVASSSTSTGTLVVTGGVGVSGNINAGGSAHSFTGTVNQYYSEATQTASYTLALTDSHKVVNMNNSTSATVSLPADATVNFPIGTKIWINRTGAGTVTVQGGAGATLQKNGNLSFTSGTMAQGEEIYVRKRAANTWLIFDVPSTSNIAASATGNGSSATVGSNTVVTYTTTNTSTFTVGT